MIIVGYQGIGKSTLAGKDNCIDLESGNFWINGKRTDDWYIPYCSIANHLSKQGYTVFTSSHEVVRRELESSDEKVIVVCPTYNLKEEWINRLRQRYETTGENKDYKALMNANSEYLNNIYDLINGKLPCYVIEDMDYNLQEIVASLKEEDNA